MKTLLLSLLLATVKSYSCPRSRALQETSSTYPTCFYNCSTGYMNIRYDRFHTVSGYVMAKSNRISLKALVELYYSIINQNKSFLLLANGTRIELNPAPVYGYLAVVNGSEYIRSQTINRPAIYNYKFIPFAVKYLTRDSLRSLLENGYMYDLYMQICTVVPNTVIYNTVYRTLGIGTVLSIIKDSQSGAWWDGRYAIAASA